MSVEESNQFAALSDDEREKLRSSTALVFEYAGCPRLRSDGLRWYSLTVSWWDSPVILGADDRVNPGGKSEVWAAGRDFADAVAAAIRHYESLGHQVTEVSVNL